MSAPGLDEIAAALMEELRGGPRGARAGPLAEADRAGRQTQQVDTAGGSDGSRGVDARRAPAEAEGAGIVAEAVEERAGALPWGIWLTVSGGVSSSRELAAPALLAGSSTLLLLPQPAARELEEHIRHVMEGADCGASEPSDGDVGPPGQCAADPAARVEPVDAIDPGNGAAARTLGPAAGTERRFAAAGKASAGGTTARSGATGLSRSELWAQHVQPLLADFGFVLACSREVGDWLLACANQHAAGMSPAAAAGEMGPGDRGYEGIELWVEVAAGLLAHFEAVGLAACADLLRGAASVVAQAAAGAAEGSAGAAGSGAAHTPAVVVPPQAVFQGGAVRGGQGGAEANSAVQTHESCVGTTGLEQATGRPSAAAAAEPPPRIPGDQRASHVMLCSEAEPGWGQAGGVGGGAAGEEAAAPSAPTTAAVRAGNVSDGDVGADKPAAGAEVSGGHACGPMSPFSTLGMFDAGVGGADAGGGSGSGTDGAAPLRGYRHRTCTLLLRLPRRSPPPPAVRGSKDPAANPDTPPEDDDKGSASFAGQGTAGAAATGPSTSAAWGTSAGSGREEGLGFGGTAAPIGPPLPPASPPAPRQMEWEAESEPSPEDSATSDAGDDGADGFSVSPPGLRTSTSAAGLAAVPTLRCHSSVGGAWGSRSRALSHGLSSRPAWGFELGEDCGALPSGLHASTINTCTTVTSAATAQRVSDSGGRPSADGGNGRPSADGSGGRANADGAEAGPSTTVRPAAGVAAAPGPDAAGLASWAASCSTLRVSLLLREQGQTGVAQQAARGPGQGVRQGFPAQGLSCGPRDASRSPKAGGGGGGGSAAAASRVGDAVLDPGATERAEVGPGGADVGPWEAPQVWPQLLRALSGFEEVECDILVAHVRPVRPLLGARVGVGGRALARDREETGAGEVAQAAGAEWPARRLTTGPMGGLLELHCCLLMRDLERSREQARNGRTGGAVGRLEGVGDAGSPGSMNESLPSHTHREGFILSISSSAVGRTSSSESTAVGAASASGGATNGGSDTEAARPPPWAGTDGTLLDLLGQYWEVECGLLLKECTQAAAGRHGTGTGIAAGTMPEAAGGGRDVQGRCTQAATAPAAAAATADEVQEGFSSVPRGGERNTVTLGPAGGSGAAAGVAPTDPWVAAPSAPALFGQATAMPSGGMMAATPAAPAAMQRLYYAHDEIPSRMLAGALSVGYREATGTLLVFEQ
ncbi:hypothetical protein GPECTOR_21g618 [Gonium pectorale]|uniref:Uncharacterized protein n=1 Tax=Gonium pectorale TaxID=33097 RepID=A0A150GHR8_GONPE|nr:hypothetical protein GPECTOR_21g618 [Gonium pectorale]|eukprot:KXZ49392.1 hypothetical protein GPECTOR_21g618 [Gonium pectorale]